MKLTLRIMRESFGHPYSERICISEYLVVDSRSFITVSKFEDAEWEIITQEINNIFDKL